MKITSYHLTSEGIILVLMREM